MSRWIDADVLKYYGSHIGDEYEDYFHEIQWVYRSQIDNAPSIDIVRCGECKWGKPYSDKQLECDALGLGGLKFPDDFCSYGQRNSSEKPNNCEPQTIRCPKCGRTDYIRDMEKDMGIKGSHYKYKCINCNTYIKDEPTISKMEQVDEPQTKDYCDICNHKGCEYCISDSRNPYCIPSNYEPRTERNE